MADEIITRIRPDLAAARQASAEQQRATEQAARQRRQEAREAVRERPATAPARRPPTRPADLPRRGSVPRGVAAAGTGLAALAKANILAAITAAGVEFSSGFILPAVEGIAQQIPAVGGKLEAELQELRHNVEKMKVYFSSAISAIQETRSTLDGAALMGAQVNMRDDPGNAFQAFRRVAYLREASKAVVQSDTNAAAVKKLMGDLTQQIKRGIAGKP